MGIGGKLGKVVKSVEPKKLLRLRVEAGDGKVLSVLPSSLQGEQQQSHGGAVEHGRIREVNGKSARLEAGDALKNSAQGLDTSAGQRA
ncbi:MAG: hypothetical protein L0212_10300 [Acidobacteria bacterium]|nr:hypothetical protein [Acidobacteriota bacterium]